MSWPERLQTLVRGEVWKAVEQNEVKVNESVLQQLVSQGFPENAARVSPNVSTLHQPFCICLLHTTLPGRPFSPATLWSDHKKHRQGRRSRRVLRPARGHSLPNPSRTALHVDVQLSSRVTACKACMQRKHVHHRWGFTATCWRHHLIFESFFLQVALRKTKNDEFAALLILTCPSDDADVSMVCACPAF